MSEHLPLLAKYGPLIAAGLLSLFLDVKGTPVWKHIVGLIPSLFTSDATVSPSSNDELARLVEIAKACADKSCDVTISITASGADIKITKREASDA